MQRSPQGEDPMSASPGPKQDRDQVPAHSPLREYYGSDEKRSGYVDDLFDRRGMKVLDVAIGTAAVARGAVRIVGPEGQVFGVDPNRGMLGEARKVFKGPLTRGVAQQLPFQDDSFDFVTMGIALRHVPDLVATFGEYLRVLKPGGTLWILEGHVPKSRLGLAATRFVWAKLIPGLTLLTTGSRDAKLLMDYYWDTVEKSAPPETILEALRKVGFEDVRYQVVVPGAFCEYGGRKR
jgi:demethylmenaquinone methyltransferase/2-methoxy-6-polyprenyl-1,4-benzoquinol methylase